MGVEPLLSRCLPGCSWRVGFSAVPLVRVCAAGMGSVRGCGAPGARLKEDIYYYASSSTS